MMDLCSWPSQSPSPSRAPKTVNPAKLHVGASPEATTAQSGKPKAHPIPRICSDWGDDVPGAGEWNADFMKGVDSKECIFDPVDGWQDLYAKYLSWDYHIPIDVPPDPLAEIGASVVVRLYGGSESLSVSIYDAYLLRADIERNENEFMRYQIVYSPYSEHYTLISRGGRVGLSGDGKIVTYSTDLNVPVRKFEELFLHSTGYTWEQKYAALPRVQHSYIGPALMHVDLDYSFPTNNDLQFLQSPKEPPKGQSKEFEMDGSCRRLLEDILFGAPMRTCGSVALQHRPDLPTITASPFTAPRQHLSLFTVMTAFNILRALTFYLSPKPNRASAVCWRAILHASSMYRSTIPFYGGGFNSDRPPVICNYHAVLVELEFLHSLTRRDDSTGEIVAMMNDIKSRVAAQQSVHGHALSTQPLYQAYSSLRHGFRLLDDSSSYEFQQLKSYLEGSCQSKTHHMSFQLQGIYRVFTKAKLQNPYQNWIQSSAYNTTPSARPSRLLLWHGTPLSSLLGILEHGLQIRKRYEPPPPSRYLNRKFKNLPPQPATSGLVPGKINTSRTLKGPARRMGRATGRGWTRPGMFGDGIYLADASSKSAGYCQAMATSSGEAVLLLCEADVGEEAKRLRSYQSLPDGHDIVGEFGGREVRCIEGVGKTGPRKVECGGWRRVEWDMDGGDVWMPDISRPYGVEHKNATLLFNEYVLFNPAHVQIRYIFRIKVNQHNTHW